MISSIKTALVALLAAALVQAGPLPDYHLGNSLTVDSELPGNVGGVDGILANVSQTPPARGWTIMSGSGLLRHHTFTDNTNARAIPKPGSTGGTDFGTWNVAFAEHQFGNVTLQPWTGGTTAFQERDAFIALVRALRANPKNAATKVWLYPGFPTTPDGTFPAGNREGTTFKQVWEAELPVMTDTTPWPRTKAGAKWMEQQVEAAIPGLDVRVVPVGEVLSALDAALRVTPIVRPDPANDGNTITYDSVWDLYRDAIHMGPNLTNPSRSEGTYTLALTMAESLYGVDARQVTPTTRFTHLRVDPAFATLAEEVVHRTVTSEPASPAIRHDAEKVR